MPGHHKHKRSNGNSELNPEHPPLERPTDSSHWRKRHKREECQFECRERTGADKSSLALRYSSWSIRFWLLTSRSSTFGISNRWPSTLWTSHRFVEISCAESRQF